MLSPLLRGNLERDGHVVAPMTWKKIIDTNNQEEYERKADKATEAYLVIDVRKPQLPIDLCYSTYEVAVKYKLPLNSVLTLLHTRCSSRIHRIRVERVSLGDYEEEHEALTKYLYTRLSNINRYLGTN